MDKEAWHAAAHGVAKSWTGLRNWTELMVMLSTSLIQFSVEGCVPSLLFDLRPNYDAVNEDNGNLLQKVLCIHCFTQGPQPCSRPSPAHASTWDSWTLRGKLESISCRVTALFSWVLVHTRFCSCLPRVCFPVLCKFWWGLMATSSKRAYTIPRSTAPRAPATAAVHCWPVPLQETVKHSSVSVSVGSLGLCGSKQGLSPPSISGGYRVLFLSPD